MSKSEDVNSPPYPGEGSTPDVMFNHLKLLRAWALSHRPGLNKAVGRVVIPDIKAVPTDKKAYTSQPVMQMWMHLVFMRQTREEWDHLIRTYEDDWDDKQCICQRVVLVSSVAVMLNNAFTPFEVWEMKRKNETDRLAKMFDALMDNLSKSLDPKVRRDPTTEEGGGK